MSFDEWRRQFPNEKMCVKYLSSRRWPNGFTCPRCGCNRGYMLSARRLYECTKCRHQTSVTAGTVFHASKVPLTKWFWAVYWMSASESKISALQLSQLIAVSWRTAQIMIRKLRMATGGRNRLYEVNTIIVLDEALIGPSAGSPSNVGRAIRPKGVRRESPMSIVRSLASECR